MLVACGGLAQNDDVLVKVEELNPDESAVLSRNPWPYAQPAHELFPLGLVGDDECTCSCNAGTCLCTCMAGTPPPATHRPEKQRKEVGPLYADPMCELAGHCCLASRMETT